jgi:hypothetical protein
MKEKEKNKTTLLTKFHRTVEKRNDLKKTTMRSIATNVLLVVCACAVISKTISDVKYIRQGDTRHDSIALRAELSGAVTASMLLWPVAFDIIAGYTTVCSPLVLFAFLWPIALMAADLSWARRAYRDNSMSETHKTSDVRAVGGILISAAWASAALMQTVEARHTVDTASMVLASVLLCVVIVSPSAQDAPESRNAIIVRQVQRCATHWAVGLFAVGISNAWHAFRKPT